MIKEESWTKDQGTQGHSLEQNAGVILGEMGDGRSQRDQGQVENLPEVDAFTEVRTKDSRIQGHPMEPNVKDVVWGEMGTTVIKEGFKVMWRKLQMKTKKTGLNKQNVY